MISTFLTLCLAYFKFPKKIFWFAFCLHYFPDLKLWWQFLCVKVSQEVTTAYSCPSSPFPLFTWWYWSWDRKSGEAENNLLYFIKKRFLTDILSQLSSHTLYTHHCPESLQAPGIWSDKTYITHRIISINHVDSTKNDAHQWKAQLINELEKPGNQVNNDINEPLTHP